MDRLLKTQTHTALKPASLSTFLAQIELETQAQLGEGAYWDDEARCLYWIDIRGKTVNWYDPVTKVNRTLELDQQVGTVVPARRGGLIVGLERGIARLDPETGKLTMLADPEAELRTNRFNDGKCDPRGRFWAGTLSMVRTPRAAALYCLDLDGRLTRKLDGVGISNGICWSADAKTMYYIDTPTQEVAAFDFDVETAAISNRRVIARIPEAEGHPDGMTIDADGCLWIAHFAGWRVSRWDPVSGERLAEIRLQTANATSCAFGGEGLKTLYITTARVTLKPEDLALQPGAGSVWAVTIEGVGGVRSSRFEG